MAESETLRDFVIRNRHLHPDEALVAVLSMPKVRAWIGDDTGRRDRLTAEFHRLWAETAPQPEGDSDSGPVPVTATGGRTDPAGPPGRAGAHAPAAMHAPAQQAPADAYEEPAEEAPRARPHVGPARARVDEVAAEAPVVPRRPLRQRHEKFLCTSCGGYDIFSESDGETVRVRCRQCKAEFPDLLELIPVVEVGPVELFFGRGREAALKVGALATLWIAAYLLLKLLA